MGNAEIWPATTPIVTKFGMRDYVMDIFHQEKNWAQSVKGFLLPIYAKYTPSKYQKGANTCQHIDYTAMSC